MCEPAVVRQEEGPCRVRVEPAHRHDALGPVYELDDGRTAPAGVRVLSRRAGSTLLELTLHEGRKHQVKRMCAAVGHPVRRLHRSGYAGLELGGLTPGESRELTEDEVVALRGTAGL